MPAHNVIVDEECHPFDVRPHYKRIFLSLLNAGNWSCQCRPSWPSSINRSFEPYLHHFTDSVAGPAVEDIHPASILITLSLLDPPTPLPARSPSWSLPIFDQELFHPPPSHVCQRPHSHMSLHPVCRSQPSFNPTRSIMHQLRSGFR